MLVSIPAYIVSMFRFQVGGDEVWTQDWSPDFGQSVPVVVVVGVTPPMLIEILS